MKAWLTLPYAPEGIQEIKASDDSKGCRLEYYPPGLRVVGNYKEGIDWHKDRAAAVTAARRFRSEWIKKASDELARVVALPEII